MGKYLITGRGGSGKSTVCRELKRRGIPAYDADKIPGLCRWEDRKTGHPIDIDPTGDIDFNKVAWAWQDNVFRKFFDQHDNFILCGSSSNQQDYHSQFDAVFVLMLDPATHDFRLRTRDFDYGKHPDLRRRLVEHHQKFARELIDSGATAVNTLQPIENVVDEILKATNYAR